MATFKIKNKLLLKINNPIKNLKSGNIAGTFSFFKNLYPT